MCSTVDPRLTLIGRAIEDLAAEVRSGLADANPGNAGTGMDASAGMDAMAERVASIWAMVAELDPGLAQRLPRYTDPEG